MEQSSFIKKVLSEIEQEKQTALKNPSLYKPIQTKPFKINYPGRDTIATTTQKSAMGTVRGMIKGNRFSRYLYSWFVTFVKLGKLRREIFERLDRADEVARGLEEKFRRQAKSQQAAIATVEIRQAQMSNPNASKLTGSETFINDSMTLDEYYFHFENKFRGSREQILEEMTPYLDLVRSTKTEYSKFPIVDIGCGRGEWLETLKKAGIEAKGIEINTKMVKVCKELGLAAALGDGISYLRSLPDQSLGGVSAFQVVEHIPFHVLIELMKECRRVLRPDGFVLFETPNPENYRVGACDFYYDMSHINPIPPEALGFLLGNSGFTKMETIRTQPVEEHAESLKNIENPALKQIAERFHAPRNYAIFARSTEVH